MSEQIECDSVVECTKDCMHYGKPIPKNQGTPMCRLMKKHRLETNPVTKSVYNDIIQRRLGNYEGT